MRNLIYRYCVRSDHPKYHHVALVKRHGRIISIGWNFGWRHAEEDAIRKTPPRLRRGATLYSYRASKAGLRNAKPCPKCSELIRKSGIAMVVYSDSHGVERSYKVEAH